MAIGTSMARNAKIESRKIRNEGEEIIKRINREFVEKVQKDLYGSTTKFLKDYEYRLNKQISDNINDLNKKILSKKNEIFEQFIKLLINSISDQIKKNYSVYIEYMIESVINKLKLFNSEVSILLNQADQQIFNEIVDKINNRNIDFSLNQEILDSIGGFILKSSDITIESTLENLILKNEGKIKQFFSKIFPDYVDLRKSATELMHEREINKFYEIPKNLKDFIKKNEVKV